MVHAHQAGTYLENRGHEFDEVRLPRLGHCVSTSGRHTSASHRSAMLCNGEHTFCITGTGLQEGCSISEEGDPQVFKRRTRVDEESSCGGGEDTGEQQLGPDQ